MHLPEFPRVGHVCAGPRLSRALSRGQRTEFEEKVSVEQAREVLAKAPGLDWWMNRKKIVIRCRECAGKDNCEVEESARFARSTTDWVLGFRRSVAQRRGIERSSDRDFVDVDLVKQNCPGFFPEPFSIFWNCDNYCGPALGLPRLCLASCFFAPRFCRA